MITKEMFVDMDKKALHTFYAVAIQERLTKMGSMLYTIRSNGVCLGEPEEVKTFLLGLETHMTEIREILERASKIDAHKIED